MNPAAHPRISIVVPSYNQGKFIAETLDSLLAQNYPNLEVVVQDGGSTDGAVEIAQDYARRHPDVFRVFVQKDKGHAHALNLGFAQTRGEILGFLNSDDTLFPGVLERVSREIDPARGRHIVFARSVFTGDGSIYVGTEHPAEYTTHFDQLAIWKRGYNAIPQPSTFWHRKVAEACGPFDETRNQGLDYLQFCRFSEKFPFHRIDEVWSTYRMHPASISSNKTEDEWLALSISYSKLFWGPWYSPQRWRCEASYWLHNREFHERACHHARRAEESFESGRTAKAVGEFLKTARLAPGMAWHRLLRPLLLSRGYRFAEKVSFGTRQPAQAFTGQHGDGWIGPVYREERELPAGTRRLTVRLEHPGTQNDKHPAVSSSLWVNGQQLAEHRQDSPGTYTLSAEIPAGLNGRVPLEVRTQPFFVPRLLTGAPDDRQLAVLLKGIDLEGA